MRGKKQHVGTRSPWISCVVVGLIASILVVSASIVGVRSVGATSGPGGTTATIAETPDAASPTPQLGTNTIIPSTSDVVINGYSPGPWIMEPNCVQPPDPSVKDYATFTLAEQRLYGIPTREPGESFAHWAKIVRSLKKRTCQYRDRPGIVHGNLSQQSVQHPADINNAGNAALSYWAGNIADEPCGNCTPSQEVYDSGNSATYWYTEIDSDWYIPTIAGEQGGTNVTSAAWVGLGGSSPADELDQAGSESILINQIGPVRATTYFVWYEWVGNQGTITPRQLNWSVVGGSHIWVRINNNNCYTIEDLDNGLWFNWCGGPYAGTHTAEAIIEKDGKYLANYGTVRFQGVGIRENRLGYQGFPNLWHDYSHMTDPQGTVLAHTDPIVYDGSDFPYDDFSIDWKAIGCGC